MRPCLPVNYPPQAGENNFYPVFLPYNVMAYRTEEWYENLKNDYEDWEVECKYPRTEQEALTPVEAKCRFDVGSLNDMRGDCPPLIEERYNGIVKIYKQSVAGHRYYFPIDTAEGVEDPVVGLVLDWRTDDIVAEFRGWIGVDEQARIAFELWKEYNHAYIAPERNGDGRRLIDKLKDMGIHSFYMTAKEKPGWWTSSTNRPVMIGDLAEAVYKRLIRLPHEIAINEFLSFIRSQKHPEGKAMKGKHDDYPMAFAIGLQIKRAMPSGEVHLKSFKRAGALF